MRSKVGIVGTGTPGKVLAAGFLKHGHQVMIAAREAGRLSDRLSDHPSEPVRTRLRRCASPASPATSGRMRSSR